MKTLVTLILLMCSVPVWSQHYLIAITRTKTSDGCGDYEYHKILLHDAKDFYTQSDILRKKYEHLGSYKEYYVGPSDFGVLIHYIGQYIEGSCTFNKYEFVRRKKSLQEARDFVQQQYTNYQGLYATRPVEIWIKE